MTRNGCFIIILSIAFVFLGLWYLTSLKPGVAAIPKTATSQQPASLMSATLEPISSVDVSASLAVAEQQAAQLRESLTEQAKAEQTGVADVATQQSWEQTQQIMQIKSDSLTSSASSSQTAIAITATPLARIQKQEQQLESIWVDIQPVWEWTKIGFTWLFGFLILGAANRLLPAFAERLRPQPQVIEMPASQAPAIPVKPEPEKNFRLHINERTSGGYASRNFIIPCSLEQFGEFCEGIVADRGKNFAEARWVRLKKSDKRPFSYHEFTKVRGVLLTEKLIMQVDPTDSRKGFIATDQGLMVFTKWATGNVDDVTFQTTPPP